MIRLQSHNHARLIGTLLTVTPCLSAVSHADNPNANATAPEWVAEGSPQVVKLREGVSLTLAPGTRLVRQPSVPVPRHLKELAPRAYSVELLTGRVDVDVDTGQKPIYAVMVRAPRHIAAFAKGGKCSIVASPQGIVVAALSGNELSSMVSDKWRSLRVGSALVVSREIPGGATRELLKQPTLQAANSLRLNLGEGKPASLNWSAVPDAQSYRVVLSQETAQGIVPVKDVEVQQTEFELPQLDVGRYKATVAAIDRFSIASPPSNAVPIRVIGVDLPEGAYLYHGIPQLGRLQQVHLNQAQGLEMAYGSAALFGPAPESLGLPTGHPLSVRFRQPGTSDEVSLILEPRTLKSTIQFEPKRPRWPGHAVKVTVRIFGPDGADLPDSVDVALDTSVNTRKIDAGWAHQGNTWITRIEQPPLAGPWILRVTASDQVGQVLAHDFIEIAEPVRAREASPLQRYSSR
jgi:hypothetical protein